MSGALFVRCPDCDRLMLGQRGGYPQPHDCPGKNPTPTHRPARATTPQES